MILSFIYILNWIVMKNQVLAPKSALIFLFNLFFVSHRSSISLGMDSIYSDRSSYFWLLVPIDGCFFFSLNLWRLCQHWTSLRESILLRQWKVTSPTHMCWWYRHRQAASLLMRLLLEDCRDNESLLYENLHFSKGQVLTRTHYSEFTLRLKLFSSCSPSL